MRFKNFKSILAFIGLTTMSVVAYADASTITAKTASVRAIDVKIPDIPISVTEPENLTVTIEDELENEEIELYTMPNTELSEEDEYMLTKLAMAEAGNQDTVGKALVMLVVLNRCSDASFPDTVQEVIYQDGQFSPIADGRFDKAQPDYDCWLALERIKNGFDKSEGALYFESKSKSKWHSNNLKLLYTHGAHTFYAHRE